MTRRRVAIGLGGNLGDAEAALRGAVSRLRAAAQLQVSAVSSQYRTAPVGGPEQPDYRNAVVVGWSAAEPEQLLALAHRIEQEYGRTRQVRWGPRSLDLDLLAVGELRRDDPALTLPHPRAHLRGFVLAPWAEIDPDFPIPGRGTVVELLAALPDDQRAGVARLPDARWSDSEPVS
jgi:2-amino-4-hydroxy-6-hydroxymethyldihydropteridine diphosphokinase